MNRKKSLKLALVLCLGIFLTPLLVTPASAVDQPVAVIGLLLDGAVVTDMFAILLVFDSAGFPRDEVINFGNNADQINPLLQAILAGLRGNVNPACLPEGFEGIGNMGLWLEVYTLPELEGYGLGNALTLHNALAALEALGFYVRIRFHEVADGIINPALGAVARADVTLPAIGNFVIFSLLFPSSILPMTPPVL